MSERASREAARIDPEALLVALVLAPSTYSRNRFFGLYRDPVARRTRRRAALVRSIVRHLVTGDRTSEVKLEPRDADEFELSYFVPSMGVRRTTALSPLELTLVRVALARGTPSSPGVLGLEASDGPRVDAALSRLFSQGGADPEDGRRRREVRNAGEEVRE